MSEWSVSEALNKFFCNNKNVNDIAGFNVVFIKLDGMEREYTKQIKRYAYENSNRQCMTFTTAVDRTLEARKLKESGLYILQKPFTLNSLASLLDNKSSLPM